MKTIVILFYLLFVACNYSTTETKVKGHLMDGTKVSVLNTKNIKLNVGDTVNTVLALDNLIIVSYAYFTKDTTAEGEVFRKVVIDPTCSCH